MQMRAPAGVGGGPPPVLLRFLSRWRVGGGGGCPQHPDALASEICLSAQVSCLLEAAGPWVHTWDTLSLIPQREAFGAVVTCCFIFLRAVSFSLFPVCLWNRSRSGGETFS